MIFYFSATGNSRYVAERIAREGEELIDISTAVKNTHFEYNFSDETLGIVSPTYDWTLPCVVSDFLEQLNISFEKKPYIYYVGTYGTTTGAAAAMANNILKKKGLSFDAMFDVKMPDTWTPIFDLSNPEHVAKINMKAEEEIAELIQQIHGRIKGKHMDITTPYFTGVIGKKIYDSSVRKTSNLSVIDACIGCGLCERKCPAEAIKIEGKKPVWIKSECYMCLGCLHRCPKFAIQCGRNTSRHGQYTNPNVKI